jgi:hypothetical protein
VIAGPLVIYCAPLRLPEVPAGDILLP